MPTDLRTDHRESNMAIIPTPEAQSRSMCSAGSSSGLYPEWARPRRPGAVGSGPPPRRGPPLGHPDRPPRVATSRRTTCQPPRALRESVIGVGSVRVGGTWVACDVHCVPRLRVPSGTHAPYGRIRHRRGSHHWHASRVNGRGLPARGVPRRRRRRDGARCRSRRSGSTSTAAVGSPTRGGYRG